MRGAWTKGANFSSRWSWLAHLIKGCKGNNLPKACIKHLFFISHRQDWGFRDGRILLTRASSFKDPHDDTRQRHPHYAASEPSSSFSASHWSYEIEIRWQVQLRNSRPQETALGSATCKRRRVPLCPFKIDLSKCTARGET